MGKRILRISDNLLPTLFSPGDHPRYRVDGDPIPKGARVINADFSFLRGSPAIFLLLESPEWDDVPEGCQIPEVVPQITEIDDRPLFLPED
jgi:hypothetical protein